MDAKDPSMASGGAEGNQAPQAQSDARPSSNSSSAGGAVPGVTTPKPTAEEGMAANASAASLSAASVGSECGPQGEIAQLWDSLRQRDAQVLVLQKKLEHWRSWVHSLHQKVQASNPQAIKNSKRLYIGGIPKSVSEDELRQFFTQLMIRSGACAAPGPPISSCKITPDKGYAFLEFRSVEEASNAMAFDGVCFHTAYLKVRRPSNYDAAAALMLGPVSPDPTMDTATFHICRTVVEDSWNKIFIGGLPCDWGDEQVKELLAPHGALKSFNLVMDKATGKSKGYAFCEFVDEAASPAVIKALHMKSLNKKMLTVKRALEGTRSGGPPKHMGAPLGPHTAGMHSVGSGPMSNAGSGHLSEGTLGLHSPASMNGMPLPSPHNGHMLGAPGLLPQQLLHVAMTGMPPPRLQLQQRYGGPHHHGGSAAASPHQGGPGSRGPSSAPTSNGSNGGGAYPPPALAHGSASPFGNAAKMHPEAGPGTHLHPGQRMGSGNSATSEGAMYQAGGAPNLQPAPSANAASSGSFSSSASGNLPPQTPQQHQQQQQQGGQPQMLGAGPHQYAQSMAYGGHW